MKLSHYLDRLDILGARPAQEYVGTKLENPAMVLEERVQDFARVTDTEDLEECLRIFQEKVCIQGFPARFSPQFWLANAALSTIYQILCGHLEANFDLDLQQWTNQLLFQLWAGLISAGPGSTHLQMMDIIMKNQHFLLWKYIETLQGEKLLQLISTLKTEFVYVEDVSADHYATLMETHIDKIFRTILSADQLEECRHELLDLYLFYLSRMNHVPPHIGPRLSHLCFLIFNRYPLENPYVGVDDWVLARNHLRVIKEVITHQNFTVGSEAQYRAPITLEKIFEAAVLDNMLEIMFKDFMTLLLNLCNYGNCRKCKRLFVAYQSGLFEQLDFKKGFETCPYWLFDQCIGALTQVANLNSLESHMDRFIIATETSCLLHFSKLSVGQVGQWHKLLVNHLVSGRALLVKEVGKLLGCATLQQEQIFNWKSHVDAGRMLVDIISDLPWTFIQDDGDSCLANTLTQYCDFLRQLLAQFRDQEVSGKFTDAVNRCVLKCTDHAKASITLVCLQSDICDFKDGNFIREVLFTVDKLFQDLDFSTTAKSLTEAVTIMLNACLSFFREKGYIAVDFNTLLMSISVSCAAAAAADPTLTEGDSGGHMAVTLYNTTVKQFIKLHSERGSLHSVSSLVPQLVRVIQECIQQGNSWGQCVNFLSELGASSMKLLTGYTDSLLELLLDWGCLEVQGLLLKMYSHESLGFVGHFQHICDKLPEFEYEDRHLGMELLSVMSQNQAQLFSQAHISQLLTMYPKESSQTQCHILDIVRNISKKGPSLLTATHFSMLTDSGRFSPLSLRQRAPILAQISNQSEDLRRQTLEYIMQYVGHKDGAVCLVAMETLVPLLKDNPGYVQKHKTRFRNLWKMSSNVEIKNLCAELLPDIKYSGKKEPQSKGTPSTPVKSPLKTSSKAGEAPLVSSKSTRTSSRGSTVSVKPVTMLRDSWDLKQNVVAMGKKGAEKESLKLNQTVTSSSGDTKSNKEKSIDIPKVQTLPVANKEDSRSNTAEVTKKEHVLLVDTCKPTAPAKPDLNEAVTKQDVINSSSNMLEAADLEVLNKQIPAAITGVDSNVSASSAKNISERPDKAVDAETKEEKKMNTKETGDIEKLLQDQIEHVLSKSSPVKPSVCLRVNGTHSIECFRTTLKNAGYNSYIDESKSQMDTKEGTKTWNAKIVIHCVGDNTPTIFQTVNYEIDQLKMQNVPVIILRMKKPSQKDALWRQLKEKGSIRFYLKPGEQSFKGGNWSKPKFCELLMQLNYYGVLQDEQLVKPDFKTLWHQMEPVDKEDREQKVHVTQKIAIPDVFISYHWGKQTQVEPLYQLLCSLGVRCWMSVYNMSGSESLYNQIVQGIHSCRVLLACVTNNYHTSPNCSQEVTIAQQLNKPIIPLVLGPTKWPQQGDVGMRLAQQESLKINLTSKKLINTSAVAMEELLQQLSKYVPVASLNTQSREVTPVSEDKDSTNDGRTAKDSENRKAIDSFSNEGKGNKLLEDTGGKSSSQLDDELQASHVTDSERTMISRRFKKRSSSMIEIKKVPPSFGGRSHRSETMLNEHDLPPGVTVDETGYTMKSMRSKSCVLL